MLYQKYYTRNVTKELHNLAQKKGWRNIFFTNTIKLQVELRREAHEEANEQEEERYGSIEQNSMKSYKKSSASKDLVIRRHSIATTRKTSDDINNNTGYLSASVSNRKKN